MPTDFRSAIEAQKELWVRSQEAPDEVGEAIYTRNNPPVIVISETIGAHEFDEAKGESERRGTAIRPNRTRKVAAINQTVHDVMPSAEQGGQVGTWDDLAQRGSGIYRGYHPVMGREGVYVYGCSHLIMFEEKRPVRIVRLRGTKYVEQSEPYTSQLVGRG